MIDVLKLAALARPAAIFQLTRSMRPVATLADKQRHLFHVRLKRVIVANSKPDRLKRINQASQAAITAYRSSVALAARPEREGLGAVVPGLVVESGGPGNTVVLSRARALDLVAG